MVASEAATGPSSSAEGRPSAEAVDLGKRLLDYYDTFMAEELPFLRNRCKGKLSDQACQDVAQEAFMRVSRKAAAEELGPDVKLGAYLRTTSWNLAVDALRAQKRTEPMDDPARVAAPDPRGEEVDPLKEWVQPAIESMPPSRRRMVVQLQSRGLDDTQIAKALDIAPARLQRDRYAAVSELRSKLRAFIRDGHRKKTRRAKKDR